MWRILRHGLPVFLAASGWGFAQIADRNINMVSGTTWPDGDPFLQRQNEPSMAASSRNPRHLLAGANDYRTVDLPGLPNGETGDAWLGVFQSYDGGQTWTSTVHPGCQQKVPQCAGAPALAGFTAAADPVVRAGANGMFYYSGIAFIRSANSASVVFVSRFIDNNNTDSGNSIQYIDTTPVASVSGSVFVDKPWLAVDVPRPGSRGCPINAPQPGGGTQPVSVTSGNLYVAYTTFANDSLPPAQIQFSRSQDCGATWSKPVPLSDDTVNQGANIAIDPVSGTVYVAWRRFQNGTLSDAILVTQSTDGGQTFSAPVVVANINPFDQGTTDFSFRSNDYPTMAVDGTGRIYIAWSQRGAGQPASGGDARVVLATSHDGVNWSAPMLVDDFAGRGHQYMPAMTFGGGQLMIIFYDLREDSTVGNFTPLGGGLYSETRLPVGDLATTPPHPEKVFTPYVIDAAPADLNEGGLLRRHTVDVWGAQAAAADVPSFTALRISQYEIGSLPGAGTVQQLQVDPPNFPMFSQGTVPFIGDYLDVTAVPSIMPGAQPGTWQFNTAPSSAATFQAVWTDDRDVRPPADGDWTDYTPPQSSAITGISVFDPTQAQPACVSGQTGDRNQNIYTARITQGLVASSPANNKALATIQRSLPVLVENSSAGVKTFRLTIAGQPGGGLASFLQSFVPGLPNPLTTLDITVNAGSSASRMVYVTAPSTSAPILVTVVEIAAPGAAALAGGLESSVLLNPDPSNPGSPATTQGEIFNPDIANPDIANPDIANPDIANPDIANPDIANPDIANPDIANLGVATPDIANPEIANPDIANPDIANPDIANAAISDSNATISNQGDSTATYNVHFLLAQAPAASVSTQLIVENIYRTPVADGCQLTEQPTPIVIANTPNPPLVLQQDLAQTALGRQLVALARGKRGAGAGPGPRDITDITDSSAGNTSITLAPGQTVQLTLRFFNADKTQPLGLDPLQDVNTIVISQAVNTGAALPSFAATHLFAASANLPSTMVGDAYTAALTAAGGTAPYMFTLVSGSLPTGLNLGADGAISGTIGGQPGNYSFSVQVTDSATPPSKPIVEDLSIYVAPGAGLAVTSVSLGGVEGSTQTDGAAVTVTAAVQNTGGLADNVAVVASPQSSGEAGASCGAPDPAMASIPAGGSQTFGFHCGPLMGRGPLAFLVKGTGVDDATGTQVPVAGSVSGSVTVSPPLPVETATATAGGLAYISGTWTNQNVVVTFTCSPATGPSTSTVETVSTDGLNQSVSLPCSDSFGDTTTASFGGIDIDRTPPVIQFLSAVPVNAAGWSNGPVTVSWRCTDSGSGPVAPVVTQIVSGHGTNLSATGTCRDLAGNSSSNTHTGINIDTTPPLVQLSSPLGAFSYPLGSVITADYSCSDAGSGIASCIGPVANGATITLGTAGTFSFAVTATDVAGNQTIVTHTYQVAPQ
ncbi:MAG: putative Ig domain-containing protein [Bryobacteraceae bacterium]